MISVFTVLGLLVSKHGKALELFKFFIYHTKSYIAKFLTGTGMHSTIEPYLKLFVNTCFLNFHGGLLVRYIHWP